MKKVELTGEAAVRELKLMRSAKRMLRNLFKPGSKRAARTAHNKELRKAAIERGEDPATIKFHASPNIHWYVTLTAYEHNVGMFINWLVRTHLDVHKLTYAFKAGYVYEYIQWHIDNGYASSTIKTYAAALAKLYGVTLSDINETMPQRRAKDSTRSRGYTLSRYEKDLTKYGLHAEIARMTGVRDETLGKLRKEFFHEDNNGSLILVLDGKKRNGKTKGGRPYTALIAPQNQARMREILSQFEVGVPLCPNPPKHLDTHGIRALYAEDLYQWLARNIVDIPRNERVPLKAAKTDNKRPHQHRVDAPAVRTRRHDGRQFDRIALLIISESLGHGRDDVIVDSYLWRDTPLFD